jgi:FtsP/CotA-like multicopper oxidase with cupredoxin domain
MSFSRRKFLKAAGLTAGSKLVPRIGNSESLWAQAQTAPDIVKPDYTIRIAASPVEVSSKLIISTTTYNGQFPGPLLRFNEGQPVTIDIINDTSAPEQLHWHGQMIPVDVDGAAEEGTPYVPAHGRRRITFTPRPSGLRFYHTHNRAGADLSAGQYSGQVGPVYIEPKSDPGRYDREVFLTLKEFQPTLSRGGDMAMDFLSPSAPVRALQEQGESDMKA